MKTYTLSLLCLLTSAYTYTNGQHSDVKIDPHPVYGRHIQAKHDKQPPKPTPDEEGGEDDDGGGNTDESPDVKSLMYYNADSITQNIQDGLRIEQSKNSTPLKHIPASKKTEQLN